MEEYPTTEEAGRGGLLGWVAGTLVVVVIFWGGLYLASLQSLQEELARHRRALADYEEEIPTAEAKQQLQRVERRLTDLKERWEAVPTYELGARLKLHGLELFGAQPGEEAGRFRLQVEGRLPALGEALPELRGEARGRRLPAVLYIQRIKRDPVQRGRLTLEGAGRISDWKTERPAEGGER